MDRDLFEVRMQFLGLLRRLTASQASIQKVVTFAVKNFTTCGEDLWECIIEECQKGSTNSRINILYFLDSLCQTCLLVKSHSSGTSNQYVDFVARDLDKVVQLVVPEGRQGLPNLISTKQVLESWRTKRVIDPQRVDEIVAALDARLDPANHPTDTHVGPTRSQTLSRDDIFKRIEEDRERHKRLRERRWVQPIPPHTSNALPPLLSFLPLTDETDGQNELPIDIEFDNDWETTSDWDEEEDGEIMRVHTRWAFQKDVHAFVAELLEAPPLQWDPTVGP